jgi:hypothetical protein
MDTGEIGGRDQIAVLRDCGGQYAALDPTPDRAGRDTDALRRLVRGDRVRVISSIL